MRTRHRLAVVISLAAAAAAAGVACTGESCRPEFSYWSGASGGSIPDAAHGTACTLSVATADASLVIDIAAIDGGTANVPCTAASFPPNTFFCQWGSKDLTVETLDVDASEQVVRALGNPPLADPVPATLTCNGTVVVGVSTSAYVQTCAL